MTMRRVTAKRRANAKMRETGITRGSDNLFADLGFPDAEERQTRLWLAYSINQALAGRGLTQAASAALLGITQPKVSALQRYKLEGFSLERLMGFLTSLDLDIEIVIRKKRRSHPTGQIRVTAE